MMHASATHSMESLSKYTSTRSYLMFSDHLPKIDHTARHNLFVIAAALVMVCQLVAMVVVADGQVKKAEVRESQMQSQRLVVAQCLENTKGAALSSCTAPVYSDNRQDSSMSQVDDRTEGRRQSTQGSANDGLMAVSFPTRRPSRF